MSSTPLGPFSAGDYAFAVSAHRSLQPMVSELLGPLRDSRPPSSTYRLTRATPTAPCTLWHDRTLLLDSGAPDLALATLLWHVNRQLVEHDDGTHLLLHAAGAEVGGRLVVIAGPSGSGKSTLVSALLRRGARYLTDETVIADRTSLSTQPYPRPVCLTAESRQALGVELASVGTYLKHPVPAAKLGAPGVSTGLAPHLIVFPSFRPGSEPRWDDVTPGEAVMELAQQTFGFTRDPHATLASLTRLAMRSPSGRLTFGSLEDATRLIESQVAGRVSPHQRSVDAQGVTRQQIGSVAKLDQEFVVYRTADGSLHRVVGEGLAARPSNARSSGLSAAGVPRTGRDVVA